MSFPPSGKIQMTCQKQYRWTVKRGSKSEFANQTADVQIPAVRKP